MMIQKHTVRGMIGKLFAPILNGLVLITAVPATQYYRRPSVACAESLSGRYVFFRWAAKTVSFICVGRGGAVDLPA